MDEKVYGYMDWPRIEAIVYGEENCSQRCDGTKDHTGRSSYSGIFS